MGSKIIKKIRFLIPLILSCILLLMSVTFCFYSIYDINRIANELANDPSASGIDYMGLGWGHGISLFILSTIGLILSIINAKILRQKIQRIISIVSIVSFILLIMASACLFYA